MRNGLTTDYGMNAQTPTRIDIRPDSSNDAAEKGLFGADGLTVRDVVDAINPLNHIPFISNLFEEMTGHTASPAAKIAGGTLLGGPVGFLASVMGVVFEQETGKGVGEAMVAALSGDEAPAETIQVASNQEILLPETPEQQTQAVDVTPMQLAAYAPEAGKPATTPTDATILDLFGGSAASAHRSYQKAQMRPYLQDVTQSQVL
jgi:hypothetical protein